MTTEQLRKEITVTHWLINSIGIEVRYFREINNQVSDPKWLKLNPEECARQLYTIGSVDSWESFGSMFHGLLLTIGNKSMNWNAFVHDFKLSQWEALTLAIRHEAEKELEKDSNLLEMDKAIEALKNS